MPKVVTRRQRKAIEAKRKAEEEARLKLLASVGSEDAVEDAKDSGADAQNPTKHGESSQQQSQDAPAVDAIPPASARHRIRGYFGKKKVKKLVRDYKRGMKSAKLCQLTAAKESQPRQQYSIEGSAQIPPVLNHISSESSSSSSIKVAVNEIMNSTNWYDDPEGEPIVTKSTLDSNDSLVAKICRQIKAQLNTVLTKARQAERQQLKLRPRSEQLPESRESCSDPSPAGGFGEVPDRNLQAKEDWKEVACNPKDAPPIQPPKVFGNTGYFMLTGTEEQLAQQLADLAARNVVVESYLQVPDPFMDKVEQQLNDLVANREELLEKMHNKHGMLASPRERRQKKAKKHMT